MYRLATTTSIINNTSTHGRLPAFQLFNHKRKQVHLVDFTSVEGKRLFRNAMVQGHAESFFKLMGNFSTQSSSSQGGVCSCKFISFFLEIVLFILFL
jgi:glutathione gamma-glutamylcysteinyltransferase